ncbi:MAG: site-2 protease family protein [Nitriliruptoraceae bacterium]
MSGPLAITVFVVSLIAAIMLHEAGHFLTARRFGMRADRFFLGFGPTLFSFRRGETEYGVKALPLGGFVRIVGMSPEDERQRPVVEVVLNDGAGEERYNLLATEVRQRGVSSDVAARIVRRARENGLAEASDAVVGAALREIIVTEIPDSGRTGDLRHRLIEGDRDRFFHERPAWERAIVLVSGSVAHFLIAVAVLVGAYAFLEVWTGAFEPRVAIVQEDSPAMEAGLQSGDRLVAVQSQRSDDYERLREIIRSRPGRPTTVVVVRNGVELTLHMTPATVTDPSTGQAVGVVGFSPVLATERMAPLEAVEHALFGQPDLGDPGGFFPMLTGSASALVRVFSPSGIADILAQATGQRERGVEGAVSVVGAAAIAGQVGDATFGGLLAFLGLIAVVNVFIGIFNLVPLPPLDGGHLAALGIEKSVNMVRRVRGRSEDYKLDPRALAAVAIPVLALLAVVVLALLWLDLTDPIRIG